MNSLSENNNVEFITSKDMLSDNTQVDMDIETDIRPVNEIYVNEIWKKSNFNTNQIHQRTNLSLNLDNAKMSWSCQLKPIEVPSLDEVIKEEKPEIEVKPPITPEVEVAPPHHARRPMNAFLIFCKKHRPIVRRKYPNLENRGVTRILGEWWALLDAVDKDAYTHLAKEYKDAFFSANPNFKWYKLPAPPLRQLPGRPTNIKQETSPPTSPLNSLNPTAEFTPGKLADESQLGMLSSLLNLNQNYCKVTESASKPSTDETNMCNNNNQIENNNSEEYEMLLHTPVNNYDNSLPPRPIKKRYSETSIDNKNISRNLFESDAVLEHDMASNNHIIMTNQHIVDNIIDSQFDDEFKDTRKSGRKGKGNRYAEFMVNGKLIKNKRDKRDIATADSPKLDLNNTIKRLEERIQPKNTDQLTERTRTISEVSDTDDFSKTMPSFNLDQRIADLPNLSYDTYLLRKKESKKRKFIRNKPLKHGLGSKLDVTQKNLTGSKKRKNKNNITHLEKNSCNTNNFDNDLSGLATLAEIAAITEKIINT